MFLKKRNRLEARQASNNLEGGYQHFIIFYIGLKKIWGDLCVSDFTFSSLENTSRMGMTNVFAIEKISFSDVINSRIGSHCVIARGWFEMFLKKRNRLQAPQASNDLMRGYQHFIIFCMGLKTKTMSAISHVLHWKILVAWGRQTCNLR